MRAIWKKQYARMKWAFPRQKARGFSFNPIAGTCLMTRFAWLTRRVERRQSAYSLTELMVLVRTCDWSTPLSVLCVPGPHSPLRSSPQQR